MTLSRGRLRLLRIVLVALALVLLIAIGGASYEAIAWRGDAQSLGRLGHLVSAGDFRLNLYCTGEGSPTVILEAGLADSLDTWKGLQPDIARFARVCSYDRGGYGYSDPGPMPRTSERIASELHAALVSAGERPPYLLVGHSFGGFNVRVFNGKYPDQVGGLVLVDAIQEDQYRKLPKAWSNLSAATLRRAQGQAFWAPFYVGLGIARLQLRLKGQQVSPVVLQSKYIKARTSEFENIQVSAEQARRSDHISDKPLVVLTASKVIDAGLKAALSEEDQVAYEQTWVNDLQLRLARLSKRGRRVVVADSSHDMPADRPDAIVTAVRELCDTHSQP
jgi:pimeloyl-ACP methyl ester carboxylesterase